ncbi:MAG: helix-hairpin-helix domain-containing protein, partial [Candidatus Kariarchaeaceae archaeon]
MTSKLKLKDSRNKTAVNLTEENDRVLTEEIDLEEIPGLGPKTAKLLRDGDIINPQQLMKKSIQEIEVLGLTRTVAKKIRENVVTLFPGKYEEFIEECCLEDIEGIGPTIAKGMREKGVNIDILETTPLKELEDRYGVTSPSAIKYKKYIAENLRGGWFTDAFTYFTQQKETDTITFGAESLDQLTFIPELGQGGIRTGEAYEFFGAFRSGKSQLCHQLCITVQLPKDQGGL